MCLTCALINPFGGDWLHLQDSDRVVRETDLPGGDVANGPSGATQIFAGDTFYGSLGYPGDWDWFSFTFEAGVTYTLTVQPSTLAPKVDTWVPLNRSKSTKLPLFGSSA